MNISGDSAVVADLRHRLGSLEGGERCHRGVLPFGVPALDARFPDGGLALGALHEVMGGGSGAADGASAALFAAGIAARTRGQVLWCVTRQDLFAPALAAAGLGPDRVVYVEAGDDRTVLACCEEGLRHGGGVGAVVGEVVRLSMTASRRLQLAAEASGAIGIAIRRVPRRRAGGTAEVGGFIDPTVAVTRWRVTARPSAPLPVMGIGRPRWRLELVRCRGGEAACFDVEACDAQGRLGIPADLADRPGQEAARPNRAAG